MVKAKELELRDARMLERLIAEIKDLSPWGRGQLQEMMNGLGPQQPALIPATRQQEDMNPPPGVDPAVGVRPA